MNSTTEEAWEIDQWEVYNDDGFIFKCQKQLRLDPDLVSGSAHFQSDCDAGEKFWQEWKKETLLKLKVRYQREIDLWDHLSNTLRTMEETTRLQQQQQQLCWLSHTNKNGYLMLMVMITRKESFCLEASMVTIDL